MMRDSDRSTSRDTRSPEEIEREIAETRRRLSSNIEELEQRMSPRRVMDQAVDYVRGHGGDMASNLGASVRDNPVPFLLTGIGLAWLIASNRRGAGTSARGRGVEDLDADRPGMGERIREGASSMADRVREGASSVAGRVRGGHGASGEANEEHGPGIVDSVKGKLHAARERVSSARGSVSERAGRAREGVRSAAHATRERASQASDQFGRMLDEQPLLMGGLALVLGSILGASLPATRKEDELMGGMRDRALDRVRDTGRAVRDEARGAMDTARREGRRAEPRGDGGAERRPGEQHWAGPGPAVQERGQEPIADHPAAEHRDEPWVGSPAVPPRPIDH